MNLFAIYGIGPQEMLIIGFISLLIFGNRLPSVMRSLGKSVVEFKKGMSDMSDEADPALPAEKKPTPTNPLD